MIRDQPKHYLLILKIVIKLVRRVKNVQGLGPRVRKSSASQDECICMRLMKLIECRREVDEASFHHGFGLCFVPVASSGCVLSNLLARPLVLAEHASKQETPDPRINLVLLQDLVAVKVDELDVSVERSREIY